MSVHGHSQPGDLPKPPILRREHVSYISAQVRRQVQAEAVGKGRWQNRPHEGLRDPLSPGKTLTPNERYAALVAIAGYVPVPLSPGDYIELLPAEWRAVHPYAVKVRPPPSPPRRHNTHPPPPPRSAAQRS